MSRDVTRRGDWQVTIEPLPAEKPGGACTTVIVSVSAPRAAVVVKRRSQERKRSSNAMDFTDEHRRQEPEQRSTSRLTQTEWELVPDLFEQPG